MSQDPATPGYGTRVRQPAGLPGLPAVSPLLLGWFARYTRWYLRRHFHSIRVSTNGWLPDNENSIPKVIFLNHASWWDPLVCLHLWKKLFSRHHAYAPIDAQAVERYAFFKRLGFFGVEPDSQRGASRFLQVSNQVLSQPWQMLWVTPQGRFADVRERPIQFKQGLGHLASRIGKASHLLAPRPSRVHFIPLAIEYVHWQERLPEILLHFGQPVEVNRLNALQNDGPGWTQVLEHRLENAMNRLAEESRLRRPEGFLHLLHGNTGVGGVYDAWRRLRARFRRQRFNPEHGNL